MSDQKDQSQTMAYLMMATPLITSLGLGGGVLAGFWYVVNLIRHKISTMLMSTVELQSNDEVFKWALKYLLDKKIIEGNSSLRCGLKKDDKEWWQLIFQSKDDKAKPQVEFTPGPGSHQFIYKGKRFWVTHHEEEPRVQGWDNQITTLARLYITCAGQSTDPIKEFIDDCNEFNMEKQSDKIGIYELHPWDRSRWNQAQSKQARKLESVVLNGTKAQDLIDDMKRFETSVDWYKDKGVPYRRGYLLYGPPGTGKTSFTLAVAGALNMSICYLNLGARNLDDDSLNRCLNNAPARSIILLEDIDAVFVQRDSVQKRRGAAVSFSGLLNALDGVRSQEGRILFMTTNHREKLDAALLRPGRADVHVELNYASHEQMEKFFLKFHSKEKELAKKFAQNLPENKISMAVLQEYLMSNYKEKEADKGANNSCEYARTMLKANEEVKEMSISEWLHRLNMDKYISRFTSKGCFFVDDMAVTVCTDGNLNELIEFRQDEQADRKRIQTMITVTEASKINFRYQKTAQARAILNTLVKNNEVLDELMDLMPDQSVTGFQLNDIVRKHTTFGKIKEAILELLNNKSHLEDPRIVGDNQISKDENQEAFNLRKEAEKKEKMGIPQIEPTEILKQAGCKSKFEWKWKGPKEVGPFEKMKELKISADAFWNLEEGQFEGVLDIKDYGTKKNLLKIFNAAKDSHAREFRKQEKLDKKLTKEQLEGAAQLKKRCAEAQTSAESGDEPLLIK